MLSLSNDKLICWSNIHDVVSAGSPRRSIRLSVKKAEGESTNNSLMVVEYKRTRVSDFICMAMGLNGGCDATGTDIGKASLVAAATVDNLITVWDFGSAQVLLSLPGHSR